MAEPISFAVIGKSFVYVKYLTSSSRFSIAILLYSENRHCCDPLCDGMWCRSHMPSGLVTTAEDAKRQASGPLSVVWRLCSKPPYRVGHNFARSLSVFVSWMRLVFLIRLASCATALHRLRIPMHHTTTPTACSDHNGWAADLLLAVTWLPSRQHHSSLSTSIQHQHAIGCAMELMLLTAGSEACRNSLLGLAAVFTQLHFQELWHSWLIQVDLREDGSRWRLSCHPDNPPHSSGNCIWHAQLWFHDFQLVEVQSPASENVLLQR